ncbi:MAG: nucleotidyltransferase domain-containing protein [Thermomicrobiales bacterium]
MNGRGARAGCAADYARNRDRLLADLVAGLERDPDVVSVWLEGSLGRGGADDLSDLDIGIVVKDGRIAEIVADPGRFVRNLAVTCLEIPAPSNAPPGGAFLLTWASWGDTGLPFQVDWYWYPASTAIRPAASRIVMERPGYGIPVAASAPLVAIDRDAAISDAIRSALLRTMIAAKSLARGNPWNVVHHLRSVDRLRATLAWLVVHGESPTYDQVKYTRPSHTLPATREEQAGLF